MLESPSTSRAGQSHKQIISDRAYIALTEIYSVGLQKTLTLRDVTTKPNVFEGLSATRGIFKAD